MKKVLVSLLVLALATASAFAAVDFTGSFVAGYTFQFAPNDADEWKWNYATMGEDGIGSSPLKLNVGVADENGIWDVTFKGALEADARLGGNANIDLGKIIMGADSDLSLKLGMYGNMRVTGYRAYTNKSGLNLDRVRIQQNGLWTNLDVAYGDLVAVQIAGGPELSTLGLGWNNDEAQTEGIGADGADLVASAIVRPINGLAVSVAYTMNGADCPINLPVMNATRDGVVGVSGNGIMNIAASVDLGAMLGTDWTFGIDVADKMAFAGDKNPAGFTNLFLATVYGGIDLVQLAVEYGVTTNETPEVDPFHYLYAGVDLNVLEGLLLNAYFGSFDLAHFNDTWFLGANVGYEVYDGVTFQVNVQYAEEIAAAFMGGDISEGSVKAAGFSITPKMVIEF